MEDNKKTKTETKTSTVYFYKSKPRSIIILKNILKILMISISAFLFLDTLLITFVFFDLKKLEDKKIVSLGDKLIVYLDDVLYKWIILILYFYMINFFKKEKNENKLYNVKLWKIIFIIILSTYLIIKFCTRVNFDSQILQFLFNNPDKNLQINKYLEDWMISLNVLNVLAIIINFFIVFFAFVIFLLKPNKNFQKIIRLKIVKNKTNQK